MRKREVINNTGKERKGRKRIISEEDTRRSAEAGRRRATSTLKRHAKDYPTLLSHRIDKGDRVLNTIVDKLSGLKKHEKSLRESEGKSQKRVSKNKKV